MGFYAQYPPLRQTPPPGKGTKQNDPEVAFKQRTGCGGNHRKLRSGTRKNRSIPERHFNHIEVIGGYNRAGEFSPCIADVRLNICIPGTDMDKDKSAG